MVQSFAAVALGSILWMAFGYNLSFTGDDAFIGAFRGFFLSGITMGSVSPFAKTIPEVLFMMYQLTFAVITVALVAGAVAERMSFSAFLWFSALWLTFVYVPVAHWVWGGGFLAKAGVLDFAGGTVVHINAGIAGLVAAVVLGKRRGYGHENLAPYDLSMAVVGTGLLWVGWFGFNGGSAYEAGDAGAGEHADDVVNDRAHAKLGCLERRSERPRGGQGGCGSVGHANAPLRWLWGLRYCWGWRTRARGNGQAYSKGEPPYAGG